jgi:hypothetical protein
MPKLTCFFPTKVAGNFQGWLNDFILPQAREPSHDLQTFLYGSPETEEGFIQKDKSKIFSIHPSYKDELETNLRAQFDGLSTDKKKAKEERKKYIDFMSNLRPAQIAAMSPFIKLYVVGRKKGNPKEWDLKNTRPIRFRHTTDINYITENASNYARGDGVGIKDIKVTRKQPRFVIDSHEISINLYFASMAAFAKKTNGRGPGPLTKAELNANPPVKYEYIQMIEKMDEDKERLILEYGWNFNDNVDEKLIPSDMKELLRKQETKKLWISWKSHNFSFTSTGEIELNIEYIGGPIYDMFYRNPSAIIPKNQYLMKNLLSANSVTGTLQRLYKQREASEKKIEALKKKNASLGKPNACTSAQKKALQEAIKSGEKEGSSMINSINKEIKKEELNLAPELQGIIQDVILKSGRYFNLSVWSNPKDQEFDSIGQKIEIKNILYSAGADKEYKGAKYSKFRKFDTGIMELDVDNDVKPKIEAAHWTKFKDLCRTSYKKEYKITSTKKNAKPKDAVKSFRKAVAGLALHRGAKLLKDHKFDRSIVAGKKDKRWYESTNFFPLRALVEAIYELGGDDAKKWPDICFGNTVYRTLGRDMWVNIGDILITPQTFNTWLHKLLYRDGKTNLTIGDLLQEITVNLAKEALYYNSTGNVSNFNLGNIRWDHYMVGKGNWFKPGDEANHNYIRWNLYYGKHFFAANPTIAPVQKKKKEALEMLLQEMKSMEEKVAGQHMIFVHFAPNEDAKGSRFLGGSLLTKKMFDPKTDFDLGLYHINIGDAKGLLTNISFSHKDNAKLRTAIALQNRDTLAGYFKYTYSASATMVGNSVFFNSGVFVIDIATLGLIPEEDPGIAGYYAIHSATDTISPGAYTTEVQGINMYSKRSQLESALIGQKEEKIPWYDKNHPDLAHFLAEVVLKSDYAKKHDLKLEQKDVKVVAAAE